MMSSTDGEQGVKLQDFLNMWQEDGTKLIQEQKQQVNGSTWYLYAVYYPESTYEYGRHGAILMKVDTKTQVIILHDCKNISGEVSENYRQGIDDWFKEHVGRY